MSLFVPAPARRRQIEVVSSLPDHWRADDLSLDALTGQAGTFARTGSGAGVVDIAGTTTGAAPDHLPRWPMWDADADGSVYERPTLQIEAAEGETVWWPFHQLPRAMTVYLLFLEGGAAAAGAGALHIGAANVATDPRFAIDAAGGVYRLTHDNGTATPQAVLSTAPSASEQVELRAVLHDDGHVLLGQSIDGAAEETDEDLTTATLQSAWAQESGQTRLYLGPGTNRFVVRRVEFGVRSMDYMREAF